MNIPLTRITVLVVLVIFQCHALSSSNAPTPFGQTTKNVATQVLQGTGPIAVDMNKYNLDSLEEIEQEWTANLVQKMGEKEVEAKLGCRSDTKFFVDTVPIQFPRKANAGLGIKLVELAGGREDGLGITVVSGLIEGGLAENSGILPGDSIAEVSIVRRQRSKGEAALAETEEEQVVKTECLGWDATVEAIQSLPPPADPEKCEEFYALSVKRLRRKPKVKVHLQYPPNQDEPDASIELFAGENLRYGMLVQGIKLNDPLAQRFDTKNGGNCGAGGLCRTCSVSVLKGGELLNPQRLAEKQMLADNPRWRLACKAIVGYGMTEGEITIRVNPRQWK